MRLIVALVLVAVVGALGLCQEVASQAKVFTFGATMDDVYKLHGRPQKWYVSQSGRFLNSLDEFQAATKVYPAIEDVYMRETPTNLYLIKVGWRSDTRTSRLRPTQRLYRLEIEVDKPAPVPDILKDLIEATGICTAGCDLYGVPDIMGNYVLAFPSKPTGAQLETGRLLATDFKPEDAKDEWCVAVKLKLQHANAFDRKPPQWNGKVVSLDIGTDSLSYELNKSDSISRVKTAKIDTWTP